MSFGSIVHLLACVPELLHLEKYHLTPYKYHVSGANPISVFSSFKLQKNIKIVAMQTRDFGRHWHQQ